MNALLVDDDQYIVQGIKKRIRWEELGIGHVYVAYNIRQAKELILEVPVEILVCDIEMPQGSGLDLLAWIRERAYPMQTIFLTSYAQFEYARRAIELKSLNYYLKPVDYEKLEQGIREAVDRAQEQCRQDTYKKESENWKRNRQAIIRGTFQSFFQKEGEGSEQELLSALKNADLPYTPDTRFLPVWLELYDEQHNLEKWESPRLTLSIENMAKEGCKELEIRDIIVVPVGALSFVLLLEAGEEDVLFLTVGKAMERLEKGCAGRFQAGVFLGVGTVCPLRDIKSMLVDLRKMAAGHVMREPGVVSIMEYENRELPYHLPAVTEWGMLLEENRKEAFLEQVEAYLLQLRDRGELSREILRLFRMDMLQLMCAVLKHTEVQPYRLFVNDTGERLYERAVRSVGDMMEYARYLAEITVRYSSFSRESRSVVDRIREFLDLNYGREITRNDLAEIVYLNPDYISRIFKKEMGMTISGYLLRKRVETAKELLENTRMPINVISMQVGYSNFSYFTKVFRESVGVSPNEYRKRFR